MNSTTDDLISSRPPLIDDDALDEIMERINREGLELLGPDGVLTGLTKRIMECASTRS